MAQHTSTNNCAPGNCTCSTGTNIPYAGFSLRSYEYQRYQTGATMFFPSLRFPGQYFDEETHLHENWNRYFDPVVGRYLQSEPLLTDDLWLSAIRLAPPRTWRWPEAYAYAANNPVANIDPDGRYGYAAWCEMAPGEEEPGFVLYHWDDADACEDCKRIRERSHKDKAASPECGKAIQDLRAEACGRCAANKANEKNKPSRPGRGQKKVCR